MLKDKNAADNVKLNSEKVHELREMEKHHLELMRHSVLNYLNGEKNEINSMTQMATVVQKLEMDFSSRGT